LFEQARKDGWRIVTFTEPPIWNDGDEGNGPTYSISYGSKQAQINHEIRKLALGDSGWGYDILVDLEWGVPSLHDPYIGSDHVHMNTTASQRMLADYLTKRCQQGTMTDGQFSILRPEIIGTWSFFGQTNVVHRTPTNYGNVMFAGVPVTFEKGLGGMTNALATWPTNAQSPGAWDIQNSNSTPYLRLSAPNSQAWSSTNSIIGGSSGGYQSIDASNIVAGAIANTRVTSAQTLTNGTGSLRFNDPDWTLIGNLGGTPGNSSLSGFYLSASDLSAGTVPGGRLNTSSGTNMWLEGGSRSGIFTNYGGGLMTGGRIHTNYSTGNWIGETNGIITLGPTNDAAKITLTGSSGNITTSGTYSGDASGATNMNWANLTNYMSAAKFRIRDEFIGGQYVTLTYGDLGWNYTPSAGGTSSLLASEANHPGIYRMTTAASSNSYMGLQLGLRRGPNNPASVFTANGFIQNWIVRPDQTNLCDVWVGLGYDGASAPNSSVFSGGGLVYNAGIYVAFTNGSNWYLVTKSTGAAVAWTDTTVKPQVSVWANIKIWSVDNGVTFFASVNNSSPVSYGGANKPATTDLLTPTSEVMSGVATVRNLDHDFYSFEQSETR
jgi:hypothetical protein